jgi:excinuclease ABC subunit B
MQRCLDETNRRRELQVRHNAEHGIIPRGVQKSIDQVKFITRVADARVEREAVEAARGAKRVSEEQARYTAEELPKLIAELEAEMREAAKELDFETAARLRDQLFELRAKADGASSPARRGGLAELRGGR